MLFGITNYVHSQVGFNHITVKGGLTLEQDFNFEIGLDFNKKYFRNWNFFFSGFGSEKTVSAVAPIPGVDEIPEVSAVPATADTPAIIGSPPIQGSPAVPGTPETTREIRNWTFGVYYEPNIIASKNMLLNWKFGTSLGTNQDNFIIDLIAGIEYNYAISKSTKISVFAKNNYMFNSEIEFRHAILIGFKQRF